jgi:hypothetical protein
VETLNGRQEGNTLQMEKGVLVEPEVDWVILGSVLSFSIFFSIVLGLIVGVVSGRVDVGIRLGGSLFALIQIMESVLLWKGGR